MNARIATASDTDAVVSTLWAAFGDDPLWRWAFPDHSMLEAWWRLLIQSAMRYQWVFVADDCAAASVWIPPGGTELTKAEEARVRPLFEGLLGERAPIVIELVERFEAAHPRDRPHGYLSLLGTHPDHRGQGLGMALLAENLAKLDAEGMPAYLESSNPVNDERYARLGFVRVGEFSTPDGRHTVSTMWREPQARDR